MAASSGAKTLPTSSSYSDAAHGSFDLSTGFPPKPSLKPDQLRDCVFRSGFSPSHNYIFRSEIQEDEEEESGVYAFLENFLGIGGIKRQRTNYP
ncbi:hypothetical protein LXL04_039770 [Taraxacum kok-saghyz]